MKPIKGNQIPKYDAASRIIRKALEDIERISLAGMEADAQQAISGLLTQGQRVAAELFSTSHAAFVAARSGEAPTNEPSEPLTADTITDEQIRALWRSGAIDSHERDLAIRTYRGGMGATFRREMRARCAGILNKRAAQSQG